MIYGGRGIHAYVIALPHRFFFKGLSNQEGTQNVIHTLSFLLLFYFSGIIISPITQPPQHFSRQSEIIPSPLSDSHRSFQFPGAALLFKPVKHSLFE